MTKRDFFILLIKVFGLFSVVTSLFSILPGNISFAIMYIDLFSIIWIAAVAILIIGLFVLLIFKAEKVVNLLKLDKGFENNKIELGNLNSSDIIKIGTFIIGGLLILKNFPIFLSQIFFEFKSNVSGMGIIDNNRFQLAINGLNLLIGYLLITNYDYVAKKLKVGK